MDNQFYIQRELDERARLEAEARALLDRVAEEKRDLSPEEDEQFNKIIGASDRHKERAEKLQRLEADADIGQETRRIVTAAAAAATPVEKTWDEQAVEAIRSLFHDRTGEIRLPDVTLAKMPFGETRALESTALVNVPMDFSSRVAFYQRTVSPWIGLATVINGTDGAPIYLPRITTDPTSYNPGQGTAITAADPVLTSTAATPSKYAALTYISAEMAEDDAISIMDYIARSQGRSIGLYFGSVTTAAVLAAATNGGTAAGTPFFDLDDVLTLIYGRAVPYRVAGSLIMSNGAIVKARKFKDSNNQYLWSPSVMSGQPDRLLGFPVYEDPYLATPASATKSVIFGDASAYFIKQLPLRTAVSTDIKFAEDQIGFKTVYRAGGALPDAAALAYLVSYTS
jgi:HK97 family phage major capsid protein